MGSMPPQTGTGRPQGLYSIRPDMFVCCVRTTVAGGTEQHKTKACEKPRKRRHQDYGNRKHCKVARTPALNRARTPTSDENQQREERCPTANYGDGLQALTNKTPDTAHDVQRKSPERKTTRYKPQRMRCGPTPQSRAIGASQKEEWGEPRSNRTHKHAFNNTSYLSHWLDVFGRPNSKADERKPTIIASYLFVIVLATFLPAACRVSGDLAHDARREHYDVLASRA